MKPLVEIVLAPGMRIVWAISAGILLLLWLLNRRPSPPNMAMPDDRLVVPVQPDPPKLGARARSWLVLLLPMFCLGAGLLLNAQSIMNHHHRSVPGYILLAAFFGFMLTMGSMKAGGARRILESLKRAEYDRAIAEADRMLRWFPGSPQYAALRGLVLRAAGRLDEAEQAYTRALAAARSAGGRMESVILDSLGNVWRDQRKFNEAEAAFKSSRQLDPQYGTPVCGLAEVYLRQDHDPAAALKLLDEGLKLKQEDRRLPVRYRGRVADVWASRADALARLGRTSEAEASLQKAAELADPACIPDMAGVLWRCGEALLHMDRESEAAGQFERAAKIDPNGLYGKWSTLALREHGAFRR